MKENIIFVLKRNPHGLSIGELTKKLKRNRFTVTKYLFELVGERKVKIRKIGMAKLCYLPRFFRGKGG
jgi:predicted transcriptional regulator